MPDSAPEAYPLARAAFAQFGAAAATLLAAVALARFAHLDPRGWPLPFALLQGGLAALIAARQAAPRWWLAIHLAFVPLLVIALRLALPPGLFLAGFLLLLLVFWRTDTSRVPLYLSNRRTAAALLTLLPAAPARVIDLGCGDGGLLRRLAQARPDCAFVGIEHAPLPWLTARLRTLGLPNLTIRHGDFWREPLDGYAVVYAFLSPAPMPRLWTKARAEMRPGALLVSNSFAIPGAMPDARVDVPDRRATRLYCYHPHPGDKAGDFAAFPAIPQSADQE